MKNTEMAEGGGIGYVWILTNNRELASKLSWRNGICGSKAEVKMISFDTDFSAKIFSLVVIGPTPQK
jgi:hypothetical protein